MWFRADLRTVDNHALNAAAQTAERGMAAVFLLAGRQWRGHDWGAIRVNFLLRSLSALAVELKKLNIPLRVLPAERFRDAPAALLRIADELGCDALYYNREYELNELRRDSAVTTAFECAGRKVFAFDDQVIAAPGSVLTNDERYYTVFTPFQRRWREVIAKSSPATLPAPRRFSSAIAPADDPPSHLADFGDFDRPDLWPAGERAAQDRLRGFVLERLGSYARRRDFPAVNGTSTLSPYLAVGAISPRQCLAAARDANDGRLSDGRKDVDAWISELVWREFYKHILVGYPQVCRGRAFKRETEALPWNDDEDAFEAWRTGRTGFPIVDAAMRQLARTGWMHNRLRMIVAMFLTKDLFIDWRRGERYFMNALIDGDLAANNGGWQWSASTGTDAAPYFRIFNPVSQGKKFDPDGAFVRRFVEELADLPAGKIHDPHGEGCLPANYPEPIVDHAEARERVLAAFADLKR